MRPRRILVKFAIYGKNEVFCYRFRCPPVETSYYRLYTTSNTISMNAVTRAWRLQLEECREEKARAS
jgi:hypothetical protein